MNANRPIFRTLQHFLTQREARSGRRRLSVPAKDSVDFSSNDFLSLSTSPHLRSAYFQELGRASHLPLGSGGSRLLDGNSVYMQDLEQQIASFHGAPAGLLFNSGFDANSGFFACVPQPGDVIVYDEYIHASVHEGMRLSRASSCIAFAHNRVENLRLHLRKLCSHDSRIKLGEKNVFIAVETVYSMDGDVCPIKEILQAIEAFLPHDNGHLVVDEAHSTGVYGPCGRGIVCELGLERKIFARLHTFGKALSSGGAIILCSPVLREYLINYARSLIYTTALGTPTLALIKSGYFLMRDGQTQHPQQRLWELIGFLHNRLKAIPATSSLVVPQEKPKSPILSLCTPYPRDLAKHCQDRGLVVRPIVPPTVPEGRERIRVCLHAGNSKQEIDRLVETMIAWIHLVGPKTRNSFDSGKASRL